jgi:hypothetical protein
VALQVYYELRVSLSERDWARLCSEWMDAATSIQTRQSVLIEIFALPGGIFRVNAAPSRQKETAMVECEELAEKVLRSATLFEDGSNGPEISIDFENGSYFKYVPE